MTNRRYLRFSLKTFLVFVMLCGVALVPLVWKIDKARKQREAVAEIQRTGGVVYYDWELDDEGERNYAAEPPPNWLRQLLGGNDFFDHVHMVELGEVNDADLVHLKGLTNLRFVFLIDILVYDAGLITDIEETQITDAGLAHLKGLTSLERLSLHQTQITDAGLVHLKGLTSLTELNLSETQVTDAGVAELQKALPNCEIYR